MLDTEAEGTSDLGLGSDTASGTSQRSPAQVPTPGYPNAVSEAFNSVPKVDVHRHAFPTSAEARIRMATWITGFYNSRRLHSV